MKSKKTKKALTGSVLALVLCFVMLLGTTFAWFTDTASTEVSRIQAGTLDIDLQVASEYEVFIKDNGEIGLRGVLAEDGETRAFGGWESVEGKTLEFIKAGENDEILWEPGCTYVLPPLRVVNNGNLSVKFRLKITGIGGDDKLNEAIEWIMPGTYTYAGDSYLTLDPGRSNEFKIAGHMKEDAGNEYMGLSIDGVAITVYATQDTQEYDSYTNQYDKNAGFPDLWDGTTDDAGLAANTDTENKTVKIENAAQLKAFADEVKNKNNTYFGYTVTLATDIDLGGQTWPGIGANNYDDFPSYSFNGTFDGNGHTIYNMTVSNLGGNTHVAGFFNCLGNNATVKNLKFENAKVTSNHQAGVVAGYCCTSAGTGVVQTPKASIENCHVNNSTVTSVAHGSGTSYDDGDKVGGIIGYTFFAVKNCTVKNTTIQGYRDIGGIVGYANANGYSAANVTGNTVENVTIVIDNSHNYKNYTQTTQYDANSIVGETDGSATVENNTATNVSVKKSVTLSEGTSLETSSTSDKNTNKADLSTDYGTTNGYLIKDGNYSAEGTLATFNETYGAVVVSGTDVSCKTLFELNAENTILLEDCNITIDDGGYLVKVNDTSSITQICFHNVKINGVEVTTVNVDSIVSQYCTGGLNFIGTVY